MLGFASFNALSFQAILGSPMILYAKSLHASATILGIFAGMMPLMVMFQIPAARHVASVGYKKFVLTGWSVRVVFIFGMVLVPLSSSFLNPESRLSLMLFLLFLFNLARGISSCGWLPWITTLIPAEIRGKYLGREAAVVNIASMIAFLVAALTIGDDPNPIRFSIVFAFSALTGLASLQFLRRIPEVPAPSIVRSSKEPVPWLAIAAYQPFRKLLKMNMAWGLAYGGMSAFTVAYLKVMTDMPEGRILFLNAFMFVGGLCSLWLLGARLDRLGSKPALTLGHLLWMVIVTGWFLLSAKVIGFHIGIVMVLMFLSGLGVSVVTMANTRLAMAVVPEMGRSHFFALYSVVGNLVLGIAPIIWGVMIDALNGMETHWHAMDLNRYAWFFLAVLVAFIVSLVFCRKLEEPAAGSMEDLLRDILGQLPLRFWLRLWPRP